MLHLKEVDNSDEILKCLFEIKKRLDPEWKKAYKVGCIIRNIPPIIQGELSDFEYYKKTKKETPKPTFKDAEYVILDGLTPIGTIYVIFPTPQIADITCVILPEFQNKGYAYAATTIIENILFTKQGISFTTIHDMTATKVSSHIAKKLGYIYNPAQDNFIKPNPNLDITKLTARG